MSPVSIRPDRIAYDLDHIAAITETPGNGSSRPTFGPEWAAARDYVIAQAAAAGCESRTDAAGNVHVRQSALGWEETSWLSGSHIDSVPHGGKYDGVTGIVVPLEILRCAYEGGKTLPLELIIFSEEEGTTFNLGMLGSRAWAGTLSRQELSRLRNRDGFSPLEAGAAHGVRAEAIGSDVLQPSLYHGFIEVHVEQGPAMWEQGVPVSVVSAINGRRQFAATVQGVANHAGSTPMSYRQDALAGFAQMAATLEQLPATISQQTVLTIGQVSLEPNAINVIPSRVAFTLDFRSSDNFGLERGAMEIERIIRSVAEERRLGIEFRQTEALPAVALDVGIVAGLHAAGTRIGLRSLGETSSGALHDAAILAPFLPTAMVFVASRDGISHNPGEFSRTEDIAGAAELLLAFLTNP